MRVHVHPIDQLSVRAAKKLSEQLFLVKEQSVLLLLSGGSALCVLEHVDPHACGSNVTLCVVDERVDPNESNFKKLSRTSFFKKSILNGATCIDPNITKNETPLSVSKRMNQVFQRWQTSNPDGVIIATLGMGDDGHIAGIMPFPENASLFDELFNDTRVSVRGYDAGVKNKFPLRVTSTLPLLRKIMYAVVYVAGESKRMALERVIFGSASLSEIPAIVLRELASVDLYTDISNLPMIE